MCTNTNTFSSGKFKDRFYSTKAKFLFCRNADLVSAEERPGLAEANLTHGVFQVRINLDLKRKPGQKKKKKSLDVTCRFHNVQTVCGTFFVNLGLLISTKAAHTAFK